MRAMSPEAKEIWSLIKETRKDMREAQKRLIKEEKLMRETRMNIENLHKIQEKRDRKLNKFMGDTGNRWGKLGENLVKGNLAQRLKERGIKVEGVLTNAKKRGVEFDIIVINGKETVVVEVKATLDPSDVDKFKKNIEKFTTLWPDFKKKTIYGAMAYLLKSNRQAESLAEKEGFFVISATGDVVIQNERDFKPKVF